MTTRRVTLAAAALLLALVGLTPLLTLLARTLVVDGRFSLHAYEGLLNSSRQWVLLVNSVTVSSLTALVTVIAGVPLGILFGRTDLPLRRTFAALFTVPLLIPPYVLAVSWADLFSAFEKSAWAAGQAVGQMGYHALFGLPGCVLVLFSAFLPVMILLTMTFLNAVNPHQEEAARLMMRWPGVLKRITLPLIVPGISLAAMLVFLLTLGEFSVASFLRYPVFPVESFVEFSAFYDIEAAMASAIPLAVLAVVILLAEWSLLRDKIHQVAPSAGSDRSSMIRLGRRRTPAYLGVLLLFVLLVAAPLAMLLVRTGSMATYLDALERAWDSLLRSLLYAMMGASLLTVLGFFIGYLIHTRSLRAWRLVDSMTIFFFALPGTVIGIGLAAALNRPLTNWVYGTFAVVVLGYLVKYSALTSRITASALQQVPRSMEEAAQVSGLRWMARIGTVVAPLAWQGLAGSWLVAFIFCLRDVEITMLVYPPGEETLPVRTLTLMANGSPELISALCVIMVAAILLPPGILWLVFHRAFERWSDGHR